MKITQDFSYGLALTGYFLLLTLLLTWPSLFSPPQHLPVALVLVITVIPLLFPLRGLLQGRRSSFIWTSYLSLFYFTHAVTEAGAVEQFPEVLTVGLELAASILLFFGAVFYLKTTKPH